MKKGKYCPICGKVWDYSLTICPVCPTLKWDKFQTRFPDRPLGMPKSQGTLLILAYDYGQGYVIFPHAVSIALEELPIE